MESKNLAVPCGIFAIFVVGLACTMNVRTHSEESGASQPAATHPTAHAMATTTTGKPLAAHDDKVLALFDGKTMKNWKVSDFGGEGPATVEGGKIVVKAGSTLSGITYTGPALPTENFEIEYDAMKLDGSDFFAALTFPYKNDCATFVMGGWGGSLVGISSINGNDAANNEYASTKEFKRDQWYHVRVRATPTKIQAWIDEPGEPILDVDTTDRTVSTRPDIDAAKPLGLSTYQTSAAYKNIVLRKL